MENITIGQIVSACGSITAIAVFFIAIFKWYKSHITDKFNQIDDEILALKESVKSQEAEMEDSKEERLILLRGLLACLDGLKQGGANGIVTKTHEEINNYLIEKSHK
jgi:uncharacterized protein YdcH (DUF465 family)